jgi:hypothetical protein
MQEYKQFLPRNKSLPKIKDSISLGLLSGLVGTLALDLLNLITWKRNRAEALYGHLGASVLMKGSRARKRKNLLFGEAVHLITGALAGIPLVYAFKASGKDQPLVKGAAFGSLVWFFYYVLGIKTHTFTTEPKTNKNHKTSLWQNIIYGLVTAKTMTHLAHPDVFSQPARPARCEELSATPKDTAPLEAWNLPHYTDYDTERAPH